MGGLGRTRLTLCQTHRRPRQADRGFRLQPWVPGLKPGPASLLGLQPAGGCRCLVFPQGTQQQLLLLQVGKLQGCLLLVQPSPAAKQD